MTQSTTGTMGGVQEDVEPQKSEAISEETPTPAPQPETSADTAAEPDPNEELWPGGPTYAQIEEWKDKYSDVYITALTEDKYIVWRTISRLEYRNIVKTLEQAVNAGEISQAEANLNNEEMISLTCILFPSYDRNSISSDMAGLASLISQEILEASAFTALEVRRL